MRNVSPRFFVDTNILAYAYDESDVARRERAFEVLTVLRESQNGAISTQVLSELYRALTRPRGIGMSPDVAQERVLGYLFSWPVFDVRPLNVAEALRGLAAHQMSYYDALIWATAKLNGIPFILSEDGQDGRLIEGVRILNPLEEGFDLDLLA